MPKKNKKLDKEHLANMEAELLQPAPMEQLTIMAISEYKGYHYLIQQIGYVQGIKRMFQYIIFDKDTNEFYQTYNNLVAPEDDFVRMGDIAKQTMLCKQMAEATIEGIIRKKDPEYKGTVEEEKALEDGALIVDAMEREGEAKPLQQLIDELPDEEVEQ